MSSPLRRSARRLTALVLLPALVLAVVSPALAAGPSIRTLAAGLDNPRGIAIGANGRLYVAAAGRGGPGGYGTSGAILTIDRAGHVTTYAGNLPSALSPEGEVTGPTNVAVNGAGNIVAVIGGGPQAVDPRFNSVLRLSRGHARRTADIQAYVDAHPDLSDIDDPPNPTDSNPYGAAWLSGSRSLVTDAANNTLLLIGPGGRITTVAKFPNEVVSTASLPFPFPAPFIPAEAVPTGVAVGPDGYWYVSELKGFPFTVGASRIWRVAPWARNVTCDPAATSGACTVFMDGFTSVTGLSFGPDGSLYVVEITKSSVINLFSGIDATGALYRVHDGVKTEIAAGALTAPDDVAVGRDGTIYVTNQSIAVGGGEVLAIRP